MVNIKQATEKLKKIVAGATLMAGIAMGTGCDTPQETRRVPTEDVVDDDNKDIINDKDGNVINDDSNDKPSENNDSDKPTENNDDDKPIENNDNNNPIENEDKDTPITDNDNPVNDDDPIENNDNDNNPIETTDNDTIPSECPVGTRGATAKQLEGASPEDIQNHISSLHDFNKNYCPHGSLTEKEIYAATGDLCIDDECNVNTNEIVPEDTVIWIDNLPQIVFKDAPNIPLYNLVHHKTVKLLNKGSPTDLIIKIQRMTIYAKDIPTASCFSPNNAIDDVSTITMSISNGYYNGCYFGDQQVSPSDIISTKNIQPKMVESDFKTACKKVPNSKYNNKKCSTTITEFAWLENVVQYLYNKSNLSWAGSTITNTKIEKDVDNNVFRMYFSVGGQYSWAVELPNAKRCLDECYGIDGCEVSINPSADISNGCKVKEPENASLTRPNVKAKKQNLPLTNQKKQARVINMPKAKRPNLATLRVAQMARRYTR